MKKTTQKNKKGKKKRVIGFQVIENECIWMKAGVVNFRLCDNAYDCYTCPFDTGMRIAMGRKQKIGVRKEQPEWTQHLKDKYDGASRPCRHALTGHIHAPKICPMNYECHHCSFDQWLDEYDISEASGIPDYKFASGYRIAEGYYYHIGHTWACFEHGGRVRIGFDDFLVRLFGIMRKIESPSLGTSLKQEQIGWNFYRDNHKASVLSPVTGTILAINHKVLEHPEIAHADPYQEGWLSILEPDVPMKDAKKLYFGSESFQWIESESQKLMRLMGPEYENLAATGGEPIDDLFGNVPELEWDLLTKTFLRI